MATYANSITLTPGTIAVDADRQHHWVMVHALTGDGVTGLEAGDMDRRVTPIRGEGVMPVRQTPRPVMPGLVPGIHVSPVSRPSGWPGQARP